MATNSNTARRFTFSGIYVLAALLALYALHTVILRQPVPEPAPYSHFTELLREGKLAEVELREAITRHEEAARGLEGLESRRQEELARERKAIDAERRELAAYEKFTPEEADRCVGQAAELRNLVMQDALLRTYQRVRQIAEPEACRTWLYTTVRNARLMKRRRHVGEPAHFASLEQAGANRDGSTPIGGADPCARPAGAIRPAETQRSSAARENSQRPVTLLQGTARSATSS